VPSLQRAATCYCYDRSPGSGVLRHGIRPAAGAFPMRSQTEATSALAGRVWRGVAVLEPGAATTVWADALMAKCYSDRNSNITASGICPCKLSQPNRTGILYPTCGRAVSHSTSLIFRTSCSAERLP